MSIVHVSTWDEFVANVNSANDIIIDADLDASGWSSYTLNLGSGTTFIDGQGHEIRNISYSHSGNLFYTNASGSKTFKNINFVNIMGTTTSDNAFFHGYYGTIYITDCKFQGRVFNFAYRAVNCTRCTFAFEPGLAYLFWTSTGTQLWDECYIDFKTQTTNALPPVAGIESTKFKDCYFKGTIRTSSNMFNATLQNCVINVFTAPTSSSFAFVSMGSITSQSLYNADRITGSATITAQTRLTGLSDSDLKSEAAVVATGFPLVT